MSEVRGSLPAEPFSDWGGHPAVELVRGERADWGKDGQSVEITPAGNVVAAVELGRDGHSLAHSDGVVPRHQPGV